MGLHSSPKQCLPERFISNLFPCFFTYSTGWFCYTPQSFSVHPSALFHFTFQVASLIITYSTTIFALFSLCQYEGFWANFSSVDFAVLFLLCFSCCSRLVRRNESCLGSIFKQLRTLYHNWAPLTTVMCACAQFTVVVFGGGLWHSFIGCSRCPFVCKCIYLYRSVYICIPRKYLCAFLFTFTSWN